MTVITITDYRSIAHTELKMSRNAASTTMTIMPVDALFLSRATGINTSRLFREAVTEQMGYRDIDRDVISNLVNEALTDNGRTLNGLLEQTSCIEDMNALLEADHSTD